MKIKITVLSFLLILFIPAIGQAETLDDLIQRIASANNQELSKLTFFELNILKNAIYSSRGFKYADDRPWLYEYFYSDKSKIKQPKAINQWHLSQYDFPKPDPRIEFKIDQQMEKAVTNIRVAIYKKIKSFKDINQIDQEVNGELKKFVYSDDEGREGVRILGRSFEIYAFEFKESIRREVHGYNCILNIINDPSQFDPAELLGVYVGSIALLKNIIEAQNGKIFDGIMGWEISQLTGVTPKNEKYDENKLPVEIKNKLKLLDDTIKKMTQSDIGDIPEQFKNSVRVDYLEGC